MKITKKIEQQINRFPEDLIFGYSQLDISKDEFQTAAKVLERLQKKGIIKKISKGMFYKPKMTVFGELRPNDQEILRPYLFQKGKRIAYITGLYLYNQLGLTTQIPFKIKIASRSKRIYINSGAIKATPVKSYSEVTDNNYQLLGFLDAMKDLNSITDIDTKAVIDIFCNKINELSDDQVREMIHYALIYPPRVRALLGAILEKLNRKSGIEKLKENLNPLTTFKFGLNESFLESVSNWNIK